MYVVEIFHLVEALVEKDLELLLGRGELHLATFLLEGPNQSVRPKKGV